MFNPISNHAEQAVDRLIGQYAESTNIKALITAESTRQQLIEEVLTALNTQRLIANAIGQQLDNIGTIVGIARTPGDSDDTYRLKIYAKIKINTSQGQPEQVIQVYALMTNSPLVLLYEYPPGEIELESQYYPPDQATVDLLLKIVGETLPAGVRCNSLIGFDPVDAFSFDGPLIGAGFGDDSDPMVGGMFATEFVRDTSFAFDGDDLNFEGFGSENDPLVGGLIDGTD